MFERFDRLLTTITRRPGPAIAALCVGILVGFTLAAAFGRGNTAASPAEALTTPTQDVPPAEIVRPVAPTRLKKLKPIKKSPPPAATRKRYKQTGNLQDAVDAAMDAAAGTPNVGIAAMKLHGTKVYRGGLDRPFEAWSTIKIPVIVLYLWKYWPADKEALTHVQRAITQSSNVDTRALYTKWVSDVGITEANDELRQYVGTFGGPLEDLPDTLDPSIGNGVPVGESRWAPATAVQFYRNLAAGCSMPNKADAARVILTNMNHLTAGNWGAPKVFPADRVFAKSGWTDVGSTVSQIAIIGRGDDAYVVGIMTEPGNYAYGQGLIETMLRNFRAVAGTPGAGGDPLPGHCEHGSVSSSDFTGDG